MVETEALTSVAPESAPEEKITIHTIVDQRENRQYWSIDDLLLWLLSAEGETCDCCNHLKKHLMLERQKRHDGS